MAIHVKSKRWDKSCAGWKCVEIDCQALYQWARGPKRQRGIALHSTNTTIVTYIPCTAGPYIDSLYRTSELAESGGKKVRVVVPEEEGKAIPGSTGATGKTSSSVP